MLAAAKHNIEGSNIRKGDVIDFEVVDYGDSCIFKCEYLVFSYSDFVKHFNAILLDN